MFRSASRALLRAPSPRLATRAPNTTRFLSTAPPHRQSRSWKSAAARWGLAIGGVYYYNTSPVFAEEPAYAVQIPETDHESETLPTIEALAAQRRQQSQSSAPSSQSSGAASTSQQTTSVKTIEQSDVAPGSPQELEEEADQQGAFNPETGEINWDCPCLGGMAHGPCGEEFRSAFSCFVYSKEEPKGIDCIDRFKGMQDCFRQHPEIYGAELADDDDDDDVTAGDDATPAVADQSKPTSSEPPSLADTSSPHGRGEKVADVKPHHEPDPEPVVQGKIERAESATKQVAQDHGEPTSESDSMVPKSWHDGR
ncbi:intermembrane space protein [Cryomyces antarcticus]